MDLSSVARDLYAVPPSEFIAARNDSVAAARAAGDAKLSRAIGALRKPSASAAAVNLLARHSEELLIEVVELGEDLRSAQEQGNGARLRELNQDRKALLKRVSTDVIELADEHGLSHSPAILNEVEGTIKAALASPEAAKAVQAGFLVGALSGAGLGFLDLSESVALPDFAPSDSREESRPKERRLKAVPDLPDPSTARIEAAREALVEANEQVERAVADLVTSEDAREENESLRIELHDRLKTLKQGLSDVQAETEEADAAVRDLDRAVVQATEARDTAHKELERANQRLDRLS